MRLARPHFSGTLTSLVLSRAPGRPPASVLGALQPRSSERPAPGVRPGVLRVARSVAALVAPPAFHGFLRTLRAADWVDYAKPPFGEPAQVLEYLGRYTHRVALSNDRLLSLEDGVVRFRWKYYARGNRLKTLALPAEEFLRRFLLHVLPDGFVRGRHFGLLANRGRAAKLARCRALLAAAPPTVPAVPETVAALMLRMTGLDVTRCPLCRVGRLHVVGLLRPGALPVAVVDTS